MKEHDMSKATMTEMIQGVKDHAVKHYEDGGWDVIVETYDDEQIEAILLGGGRPGWQASRSVNGAIARMKSIADLHREADAPHKAEREAGREPEETAKERKNRLARERRQAAKQQDSDAA